MKYKFEINRRLPSFNEEWKDIKNYEGLYQVSNLGNVRSLDRKIKQKNKNGEFQYVTYKGKILKIQKQKNGYLTIDLHKRNKFKRKLIHKLVAEMFIPNPNNYKCVNHKDSNIQNNRMDNLEWCTQSYNIKYAYDLGNKIPPHMKAIKQIKDGKTVNIFKSIALAERQTNIKGANISKCCRKLRNYAGGYQWQYIEQK